MAACRACLTPRPRVPPARPDSSAACCWLLPCSVGGWGFPQIGCGRSCCFALIGRLIPPAFSSFICHYPAAKAGSALAPGVACGGAVTVG